MSNVGKVISVVIAVVVIFFGWKYYADNYQAHTAYAIVPEKVPAKVKTVDDDGTKVPNSYSYKYNFKFVLTNGETRNIKFELLGSDPKPFVPGSLIKADVSSKRVIKGPNGVNKKDVPEKVRTILGVN